jgi:oligoribonuclease
MESSELMFWVDLETTGLDPRRCGILEVAVVITDGELNRIASAEAVVHWDEESRCLAEPVAHEMHLKNGLWEECEKSVFTPSSVERMMLGLLVQHAEKGQVPMCGSTIAFDRSFLKLQMPTLEEYFHYRNYDVSVYTEEARRRYKDAYVSRPQEKQHRAMGDILQSIELLKHWRGAVLR